MRMNEPGWIQITPFDKAGRRAIWTKIENNNISFCAGREGDDIYFTISLDKKPTLENLVKLIDLVDIDMYSKEDELKKLEGMDWLWTRF